MKTFRFKNGIEVPALGFGTWQLKGDTTREAVSTALEVGYRHIDTADVYGNHEEVGEAIMSSGIPREEIFVTTKVWRDDITKGELPKNVDYFLEELQLDYIDLLLIHWPNKNIPIAESLGAMDKLKDEGKIRSIGVSNFTIAHLEEALKTGVEIVNNQVELHPSFNQNALKSYCDSKEIVLTAYSPIGQGKDLEYATSAEILAWIMNRRIIAIPRSADRKHIEDNFKSLELELTNEQLEKLNSVPQQPRLLEPSFAEF